MRNGRENITILGSTGSIGTSTLSVVRENPDLFRVVGLSCDKNIELLSRQIEEFSPVAVAVGKGYKEPLMQLLENSGKTVSVFEGVDGFIQLAEEPLATRLVAAMVGAAGIKPVMRAIASGKHIALANKESLVLAGSILLKAAKESSVLILPVDSEHNAIFQSLRDETRKDLDHITLTASGGPFRQMKREDFSSIQLKDALNHPNWEMGEKITIDSATMMNKCLEIIEAKWLFDISPDKIRVLIHPQSIVHSMVTFKDGSTICQMGVPDMRIPISHCLGYPERIYSGCPLLNLSEVETLTFESPDIEKFPTLAMAYDVLALGGGAPAALNGANEVLVDLFVNERIPFPWIFSSLRSLIDSLASRHKDGSVSDFPFLQETRSVDDALKADQWGRDFIDQLVKNQ